MIGYCSEILTQTSRDRVNLPKSLKKVEMRAAPLFSFFLSRRSNSGTRYGSREPFWTPPCVACLRFWIMPSFHALIQLFISLRRSCKPWLLQNGGENSDKVQCMGMWACCVWVCVLAFGLCNFTSSPWQTFPDSTRSQTERTYSTLRDIYSTLRDID